jgi:N-acetylglucosamine-6-sulfatase
VKPVRRRGQSNSTSRRKFLKSAALGAAWPLARGFSQSASPATPKRNLIFILVDDMRFDSMSRMGHPFLKTPNLDRLVANGMLFRNAFVTTSLCSPSRASTLTGMYAHMHGVQDNSTLFTSSAPTFPALLQAAGYETAFVGKWHMGDSSDKPRPGFDRWVSFRGQGVYYNPLLNVDGKRIERQGYVTDLLTDYALEFLRKDRRKPFFLYLSHKAVHADFQPAERHRDAFADVKIALPDSMAATPENFTGKPLWVKRQRHSWHGVDYLYHDRTSLPQFILDYCRTLLAVDESVGRLLATLQELGLLDSTLVMLTSDNGFLMGEHGLIDKRCMYEESIRVPLLAHCPQLIRPGSDTQRIALNIDVAPTLLDAAGAPIPGSVQGASLLPLLRGEDPPWRRAMLYEYFWEAAYPQTPTVFGVRTERYKYMHYHGIFDLDELYDLQKDPHEMRNLIDDAASFELRQEMRQRLEVLLGQYGATMVPRYRAA